MKYILKILEEKKLHNEEEEDIQEQEIEEVNVTGNMDGGAGPPKTPHIFQKKPASSKDKKKEDNNIKASTFKKAKESRRFTVKLESIYKKMMEEVDKINEISYRDYKKDESHNNRIKLNKSLIEINRRLAEIDKIIENNIKLKTEFNLQDQFWRSSAKRIGKISERIIRIGNRMKELSK